MCKVKACRVYAEYIFEGNCTMPISFLRITYAIKSGADNK